MLIESLGPVTQFGVAGLMGALWIWERSLSRKRERQLNEAHEKLVRQHRELRMLVQLVRRNTRAVERFDQTQQELRHVLERMRDEHKRNAA